jgi:hypothetical protein
MRLAQAKAEESIIDAHVRNTLMFIDTLAEDMAFDRAIDTYVRVLRPKPDPATQVTFSDELEEVANRPEVRLRAVSGEQST